MGMGFRLLRGIKSLTLTMFLFLIIIFISCNSTNKPTCLDISERPDERDYIMKIEREREKFEHDSDEYVKLYREKMEEFKSHYSEQELSQLGVIEICKSS